MSVLKDLVKKLDDEDVTELMLRPDLIVLEDKWSGPIAYIIWPVSNDDGYIPEEQAVMLMKQELKGLVNHLNSIPDFEGPGLKIHISKSKNFTEIVWTERNKLHRLTYEVSCL